MDRPGAPRKIRKRACTSAAAFLCSERKLSIGNTCALPEAAARRAEIDRAIAFMAACGIDLVTDAQQVLHVMANLVCNHIGLRELARCAEARAHRTNWSATWTRATRETSAHAKSELLRPGMALSKAAGSLEDLLEP